MVLIQDYIKHYDYVTDPNSNLGSNRVLNKEKSWNGYHVLQATYNFHKFKKSQSEFKCVICGDKFPKKSRYIGATSSEKICIKCAGEWFKNSEISLNQIKDSLRHNAQILYDNKEKWEEEMVLNSL